MADSQMRIIIQAVDKASKEFKQIATNAKNMGGEMESASGNMASGLIGIGKAMAVVTATIIAAKKVWDLGEQGAGITRMELATSKLATSYGSSMRSIVDTLQESSLNTISRYDAMAAASNAMMLGLGGDAEKLGNLMEIAAYRGRAMGLSTTQAFSDIVRGIGRMSPLILDNLGIMVDADNTYANYAESIGKATSELTNLEKRQALLNDVLSTGNDMLKESGGLTADVATGYERASRAFKDFWGDVGKNFGRGIGAQFLSQEERKLAYQEEMQLLRMQEDTYDEFRRKSVLRAGDYGVSPYENMPAEWAFNEAKRYEKMADGYASVRSTQASLATETRNYTDEALLQAATMKDVTKAFEKYNAALEKANNISNKTKKDAAITEAFNEFGESIEDVTLKLASMAGISASVLMNVSASMGEVDESTKEAFIAMTELLSLPASVQAQGILDINAMLGLSDQKEAAAKIKEYMHELTQTDNSNSGASSFFGDMTATMGIDATLTTEANDTINAALAPGTKTIYINYVDGSKGGGGTHKGSWVPGGVVGGMASGGPVQMGQPYIIGERGPEMFVPNANGTIVANNKLASGGSTFKFYDKVNFVLPDNGMNASDLMRQMGVAA